jgi:hypothetical protein
MLREIQLLAQRIPPTSFGQRQSDIRAMNERGDLEDASSRLILTFSEFLAIAFKGGDLSLQG